MPFTLDIDPVAFAIGGISIRWYGLLVVVAAIVAVRLALLEARRHGISDAIVSDGVVWVGAGALVGGRALYVVQNELAMTVAEPLRALMIWHGGLSFYGGLIAGLAMLALFAVRRGLSPMRAADIAAPGVAIGQAIGHVGCLIGGDSFGTVTSVPWAVVYRNPAAMAPLGVPLHPTQAYEAIALTLLFVGLWVGRHALARIGDGAMTAAYLIALSVIRFVLFFLRDEPAVLLGLKTAQWIGLGIGAAGVALLIAVAVRGTGRTPITMEATRS